MAAATAEHFLLILSIFILFALSFADKSVEEEVYGVKYASDCEGRILEEICNLYFDYF